MRYARQTAAALALAIIVCGMAACNDYVTSSYKTLAVMGTAYNSTMSAMAEAYSDGLIDDEAKADIIKAGNIFYASYHTARIALATYAAVIEASDNATDNATDSAESLKASLAAALSTAQKNLTSLKSVYSTVMALITSNSTEED
ncbi:MAG: hypothetical protein AB7D47_13125 [Desulfovibrio sp.]